MKKKDLIALVLALVLLVGVGYYFLSQNSSKTSSATSTSSQVEVAPVIPDQLDPNGTLAKLGTTYKVQDYKQPVNLSGLGNPAPFSSQ